MRARRDLFARCTYAPIRRYGATCTNCGSCKQTPTRRRRYCWVVEVQHDGDRTKTLAGWFCSWGCAEALHGRIGR